MINSVKVDLIKKVKGILKAEGFEIRPRGLALVVIQGSKSIATVWPDNSGNLNLEIEAGSWEGLHKGLDIKKVLLLVKDVMKEIDHD